MWKRRFKAVEEILVYLSRELKGNVVLECAFRHMVRNKVLILLHLFLTDVKKIRLVESHARERDAASSSNFVMYHLNASAEKASRQRLERDM